MNAGVESSTKALLGQVVRMWPWPAGVWPMTSGDDIPVRCPAASASAKPSAVARLTTRRDVVVDQLDHGAGAEGAAVGDGFA